MIKAENLRYEYVSTDDSGIESKLEAVAGVNLVVEKGEFLAILGHNGSGKSTLAKMLNALLIPTGGMLWVNGYDTKNQELVWDIRQSTGYVFQNPDNQIISTIVEDDVAFGPENLGVEPIEIRRRVDEVLAVVRMSEYAKRAPHQLSGGQKQRIAIAGVLAMKPACIVLDEPTAMLDPSGRKEVMDTVMKLNKEAGITIIHITHYMEETVNADRVIVMEKGKIVLEGTPKEIFVQVDKLKEIGLDVPQVTLLSNNLRKRGIDIAADVLTVEEMVGEICRLKLKI